MQLPAGIGWSALNGVRLDDGVGTNNSCLTREHTARLLHREVVYDNMSVQYFSKLGDGDTERKFSLNVSVILTTVSMIEYK